MLWLSRPPFLRWLAAAAVIAIAAWSEFAPQPVSEIAVLNRDIAAGTPLTDEMVDVRRMPDPGFSTVEPHGIAATSLRAGDPLIASMLTEIAVPSGWVALDAELPSGARPGAQATGVILAAEAGQATETFPAVIVEASNDDAFGTGTGTVAVPPEWIAAAGAAAAGGRLVIGVELAGG